MSYASSRRPRVVTRLAPTVRAPSMRLRSESLTGPRGVGHRKTRSRPQQCSAAPLASRSQAYHRRPFAPHDQLIQPPALLSLGRCSRSGVPDHVGRPGIVVQTPQLEHNLPVATGEARRRGSSRNGMFAPPALHGRTRRPTAYATSVLAAPPRMTGLSAPRLGEARALLGTARPRRCLTAAAVRGWAGTSRCRGTPATAGAAGGAGRTRSHDAARPWVRQCARRLLQWGQSLTARPARGAGDAQLIPDPVSALALKSLGFLAGPLTRRVIERGAEKVLGPPERRALEKVRGTAVRETAEHLLGVCPDPARKKRDLVRLVHLLDQCIDQGLYLKESTVGQLLLLEETRRSLTSEFQRLDWTDYQVDDLEVLFWLEHYWERALEAAARQNQSPLHGTFIITLLQEER